MISLLLVTVIFAILLLRWAARLRELPPGPILPLQILRQLWWSKFYGISDVEIIRTLQKEYGGIFSVNIGYTRAIVMSDFDRVQV